MVVVAAAVVQTRVMTCSLLWCPLHEALMRRSGRIQSMPWDVGIPSHVVLGEGFEHEN